MVGPSEKRDGVNLLLCRCLQRAGRGMRRDENITS